MSPNISTSKPDADEKGSSVVKPPDVFDGSHAKYRDWIHQVKLFHRGKHLSDDDDKIISALSYMREGSAMAWAQKYSDDHLDTNSMGKWTDFLTALNAAFKDHTTTKRACDKVEHLFQGKIMIDEFMNNFETLLADAELMDNNEKI